jgi:hypothetical protein
MLLYRSTNRCLDGCCVSSILCLQCSGVLGVFRLQCLF